MERGRDGFFLHVELRMGRRTRVRNEHDKRRAEAKRRRR